MDPLKTKYLRVYFLLKMASKGTAAKSASGASMSKYDVEVEARLQALEAHTHSDKGAGGSLDAEKLEELWQWYQEAKKHV